MPHFYSRQLTLTRMAYITLRHMAFLIPFLCLHMCNLSHSFGLHGQTDWTVVKSHLIFECIASVFTTHSSQLGQKEVFT